MQGRVIAVSLSGKRGVKKRNCDYVRLIKGLGIENDAHSGNWHRQVSLLGMESIEKIACRGLSVGPGDFAENITTAGVELVTLNPGERLRLGREVELEITQIGKTCHSRCNIFKTVGDCVMPSEGVFAVVLSGGEIRPGDTIEPLRSSIQKTLHSCPRDL